MNESHGETQDGAVSDVSVVPPREQTMRERLYQQLYDAVVRAGPGAYTGVAVNQRGET